MRHALALRESGLPDVLLSTPPFRTRVLAFGETHPVPEASWSVVERSDTTGMRDQKRQPERVASVLFRQWVAHITLNPMMPGRI
jgi:hypothetical protein